MLLLAHNTTVTYCHSHTNCLPAIVSQAVAIAAVDKPRFVRGEWLKPGCVVVKAGYNEGNIGDVAFEEANIQARVITPVPGGAAFDRWRCTVSLAAPDRGSEGQNGLLFSKGKD
jgi:methylenetetrahydrofolate dehydrogenase (NADP+)/methenyltetrahydrofolate cyclohydrolase